MQTEPPAITPSSHPYDALTPEVILDAIEAEGFEVNGRLFALNSYEGIPIIQLNLLIPPNHIQ